MICLLILTIYLLCGAAVLAFFSGLPLRCPYCDLAVRETTTRCPRCGKTML
jgi:DNA-directed RNA polymerase subunit RPC12/RpoP